MIRTLPLVLLLSVSASAQVAEIPFQGRLADAAGNPLTQTALPVTFALYDAATGGTEVWTETDDVDVADGVFTTRLGDSASLFGVDFTQDLWLELTVGDGANAETLAPRTPLGTVPTAFDALNGGGGGVSFPLAGLGDAVNTGLLTLTNTGAGDGLQVADAGRYGVRVSSADLDGVSVGTVAGDGVAVSSAGEHGLSVTQADEDGVFVLLAGDDGVYVGQAAGDGIHVSVAGDTDGDGTSDDVTATGLRIDEVAGAGIFVEEAGVGFRVDEAVIGVEVRGASQAAFATYTPDNIGLNVAQAGREGVLASGALGNELKTTSTQTYAPDLVLGSTGAGVREDDGVLASDLSPSRPSSDLVLISNDNVAVVLNRDGGDEDSDFEVLNQSGGDRAMRVTAEGDLTAAGQVENGFGAMMPVAYGRVECNLDPTGNTQPDDCSLVRGTEAVADALLGVNYTNFIGSNILGTESGGRLAVDIEFDFPYNNQYMTIIQLERPNYQSLTISTGSAGGKLRVLAFDHDATFVGGLFRDTDLVDFTFSFVTYIMP